MLAYARETVQDDQGGARYRQRVRWWSALALLRSLASSPAAAAATLRSRAAVADAETPEEADEIGRRTVLDLDDDEGAERLDVTPGADPTEPDVEGDDERLHRRLLDLAREAEALCGDQDAKLKKAVKLVKELLKDGYRPIVFCRFIPTAEYLAQRAAEPPAQGRRGRRRHRAPCLPPSARSACCNWRKSPKRVLVCTDCLSEGINLQEHFDAVVHYDLSWNPTRHEQREGRVDRYGQPTKIVRVVTYYGVDNQIDGLVLDVLIRKHKAIRSSLGVSVPVPANTNQVIEAVIEGLLLRGRKATTEHQAIPALRRFRGPEGSAVQRMGGGRRPREAVAHDVRPGDDQARRSARRSSQAVAIGDRLGNRRGPVHAGRASPSRRRRHRAWRRPGPDRPRRECPALSASGSTPRAMSSRPGSSCR